MKKVLFSLYNEYRIASVGSDGSIAYSGTAAVTISTTGKPGINAYPNPAKAGEDLKLSFANMPAGEYDIQLTNSLGQVILTNSVTHATSSSTETLSLTKYIAEGSYQLQVLHPDKTTTTINIIIAK